MGPVDNWPYNRPEHKSDDHITGISKFELPFSLKIFPSLINGYLILDTATCLGGNKWCANPLLTTNVCLVIGLEKKPDHYPKQFWKNSFQMNKFGFFRNFEIHKQFGIQYWIKCFLSLLSDDECKYCEWCCGVMSHVDKLQIRRWWISFPRFWVSCCWQPARLSLP